MKLCVKKVRCHYCQRMVKCHEQESNGLVQIVCPICGKTIYTWNGVSWRTIRK